MWRKLAKLFVLSSNASDVCVQLANEQVLSSALFYHMSPSHRHENKCTHTTSSWNVHQLTRRVSNETRSLPWDSWVQCSMFYALYSSNVLCFLFFQCFVLCIPSMFCALYLFNTSFFVFFRTIHFSFKPTNCSSMLHVLLLLL